MYVIGGRPEGEWATRVAAAVRRLDALASRPEDAATVAVVMSAKAGSTGPGTVTLAPTDAGLVEIAAALASGRPVVPVLVGGALLSAESLPEEIRDLAFRHGLELPDDHAVPVVAARLVATARTAEIRDATSRPPRAGPGGVFLSYRRDDSALWVEPLARALTVRLGRDGEVFFDVGTIAPGTDFRRRIREAIERSSVFVLVIGRGFLERDAHALRRIDRSNDVVRFEIRSALDVIGGAWPGAHRWRSGAAAGSPVPPRLPQLMARVVCVGGAEVPSAGELPDDIAAIARWPRSDGRDLPEAIEDVVRMVSISPRRGRAQSRAFRPPWSSSGHSSAVPRSEAALARLAELGWTQKLRGGQRTPVTHLVNPRFPRHRFLLQTNSDARLTLEQRTVEERWKPKAVFSLSLRRRDAFSARLGDHLVEAAVDPERFVERLDPKTVVDYSDVFRLEPGPNPAAIEPYQRTRRRVTSAGGVPELVPERRLGRPAGGPARALAFDPLGRVILVATDRTLDIVELGTWTVSSTCRAHHGWDALDVSPQGWVALGSYRGHLAVLDHDLNPRVDVPARDGRHPSGTRAGRLVTISWSSTAELLAAAIGRTIHVVQIPSGRVHDLPRPEPPDGWRRVDLQATFVPGTNDLFVADGASTVAILDARSGKVRTTLTTSGGPQPGTPPSHRLHIDVATIAASPDGTLVAFAGSNYQIAIARPPDLEVTDVIVWSDPAVRWLTRVRALAFSPDGRLLATVTDDCYDRQLLIGDLTTLTPTGVARLPSADGGSAVSPRVAWSPDASRVATVSCAGTVDVWRS